MIKKLLYVLLILIFCNSCDKKQKEPNLNDGDITKHTLFEELPAEETHIDFFNEVENQQNFNIFKYRNFYNGGGVAIGDINNDGLADVYLTSNMGSNKLYLNKGGFVFEDITDSAGVAGNKPWSTGVVMADINADGLLDIYVSNAGNMEGNNHDNDLYINKGDLTFEESAEDYNLAKTGFSTHASFFDYDKDGDLDAYILNNSNIPVSSLGYAHQRDKRAQDWENVPHIFRGVGDMLLRNDNGKFVDVSEEAGIYGSLIGFGLGVMITDINNDLLPDIYVSNDFYERDYLYINKGDGTFKEDIKNWVNHLSLSAMGIDIADINNDGYSDIFITDMLPEKETRIKSVMEFESYNVFKLKQSKDFYQQYIQNTLQLNNGNNTFSEIANYSGVAKTDWSWAGLMFDMDNDGYRDLYVTNGVYHDLTDLDFVDFFANEIIQKMVLTGKKQAIDSIINKMPQRPQPNFAYHNNKDLTFTNKTNDWGFSKPSYSNGAAYGDLDNDGDLDMVVNNVNMNAFVYKNHSDTLHNSRFLRLKLIGTDKNKFAIGAKIMLYKDKMVWQQEQIPSRGFQSSMDYVMNIGLGSHESIDSLRIIWPDDATQLLTDVPTNQLLELKRTETKEIYKPPIPKLESTLLTEIDQSIPKHEESTYSDFDYEGLISKLLSQEGPAMAVGDVDGDGNEDVFMGGAKNQMASLLLNKGNGKLITKKQPLFEADRLYEDTAAAFLDIDVDGDQDLIIGSGGNEIGEAKNCGIRLYLNDGKGNFYSSDFGFKSTNTNVGVIAVNDFNNDNYPDVFVGSRSVVGTYGIDPSHYLYVNKNGILEEGTERYAYDLKDAGMITDALWADVDGDSINDLITSSEWGIVNIYKNSGRALSKMVSNLDDFSGLWQTVEAQDLDGDGDVDLVLGNQGNNTLYKMSSKQPMKLFINDYDDNGTIEQIVTVQEEGKDFPIHMKKELTSQVVSLKKQNLKASVYSQRSIQELFSKEVMTNAIVKTANLSESIIALNDGAGNFKIKKLPSRVQLSCICGILCTDVNKDGMVDLVMAGNNFEFKPQFSRLDASYGAVLLNQGEANFEWEDYKTSGFFIKNEVKHLEKFSDKNGRTFLIAAINNQKPRLFEINL